MKTGYLRTDAERSGYCVIKVVLWLGSMKHSDVLASVCAGNDI